MIVSDGVNFVNMQDAAMQLEALSKQSVKVEVGVWSHYESNLRGVEYEIYFAGSDDGKGKSCRLTANSVIQFQKHVALLVALLTLTPTLPYFGLPEDMPGLVRYDP